MSEPRTQRSGLSGRPSLPLTPLRCVRGSDDAHSRGPLYRGSVSFSRWFGLDFLNVRAP